MPRLDGQPAQRDPRGNRQRQAGFMSQIPASLIPKSGTQPNPTDQHIHALQRQRARIERHLENCRAAAANSDSPNPPLGPELDDACASLARVRAELMSLAGQRCGEGDAYSAGGALRLNYG
jgi:hypothetical protein